MFFSKPIYLDRTSPHRARSKGVVMTSRIARRITTISLFALLFSIQLMAQNQSNYIVTNLGTLGGSSSSAISINNNGLVSGFSFLPGDQSEVAVVFKNGVPVPLGTLGGPNSA